jgi:hypothetical protein
MKLQRPNRLTYEEHRALAAEAKDAVGKLDHLLEKLWRTYPHTSPQVRLAWRALRELQRLQRPMEDCLFAECLQEADFEVWNLGLTFPLSSTHLRNLSFIKGKR